MATPTPESTPLQPAVCAICLEAGVLEGSGPEAGMCACKGTCGTTHPACLDTWRQQFAEGDERRSVCMQCHEPYEVDPPPPFVFVEPDVRRRRPSCRVHIMIFLCVSYGLYLWGEMLSRTRVCLGSADTCAQGWMLLMTEGGILLACATNPSETQARRRMARGGLQFLCAAGSVLALAIPSDEIMWAAGLCAAMLYAACIGPH